jgi:hypothetical protein
VFTSVRLGVGFSALLGDDDAGMWMIRPVSGGDCTRRRYREDTLIIESDWERPMAQYA